MHSATYSFLEFKCGRFLTVYLTKLYVCLFSSSNLVSCPVYYNLLYFNTPIQKDDFWRGGGTESVCLSRNWCYPTEKEASNEISVITATRPRNGEFSYRIHAERMGVVAGRGGEKINLLQPLIAGNQSGAVTVSTPQQSTRDVTTVLLSKNHCSNGFIARRKNLKHFLCPFHKPVQYTVHGYKPEIKQIYSPNIL